MMPIAQATLIGLPDLLRDQVRGPGEERKERDRDRGLSYSQHVDGMAVAGTAAKRASERQRHQGHQETTTDHDCKCQEQEGREDKPLEIGLDKPDDPACQQQRADDGGGGSEKAPLLGGKERDGKADPRQDDAQRRAGREGRFEGDDPGCHRDRAK
jgi:hypothetical protein